MGSWTCFSPDAWVDLRVGCFLTLSVALTLIVRWMTSRKVIAELELETIQVESEIHAIIPDMPSKIVEVQTPNDLYDSLCAIGSTGSI